MRLRSTYQLLTATQCAGTQPVDIEMRAHLNVAPSHDMYNNEVNAQLENKGYKRKATA